MRNFFEKKYCKDIYDISQIRKAPLTNDELKEVLPYKEDRDKYLELIKELYLESLLFGYRPKLHLYESNDLTNKIKKKFFDLLDFCLLNGMIDRTLYMEFGGGRKEWDISFLPLRDLNIGIYNKRPFVMVNEIETLDEYRVRVEEFLADQESSWYLDLRYNFSICFSNEDNEEKLYYYDINNCSLIIADNPNIALLWKKINIDISVLETQISDLEAITDEFTRDNEIYDKKFDAFKKRRELYKELLLLKDCLDMVEPYYEMVGPYDRNIDKETNQLCEKSDILYIYKGIIGCHRHNHNVIQATAICYDSNDREIPLNVEYCSECKKYLLEFSLFERYRNFFKILIGNFRMADDVATFNGEYDLALESPLKLSGYSVSQKDGFSSDTRQLLLARIIYNNIMSKGDVIKYLSYFIRMQGSKHGNEIALEKWEEDLRFVQNYDIRVQPKVFISEIKKY